MSYKFRFRLVLQDKFLKEACELMRKMDLDLGEVGIEQIFVFTSEKDKSIADLKEDLRKAVEACGMSVIHIDGGKVE